MPLRILLCFLFFAVNLGAQTVQPVITEYKGKAEGKFTITNNTLTPMAVVLEPKSFSITPEGKGIFRKLDPAIHVQLSTMSVVLQPQRTYYIFYKATADELPAWFTIYATFSSTHHGPGLDVRIMLPHTVYLYQKRPLEQSAVQVKDAEYLPKSQEVICDLENESAALGRVREVRATGARKSASAAGFPLLPRSPRQIRISWKESDPPAEVLFHFDHFTIQHNVRISGK